MSLKRLKFDIVIIAHDLVNGCQREKVVNIVTHLYLENKYLRS